MGPPFTIIIYPFVSSITIISNRRSGLVGTGSEAIGPERAQIFIHPFFGDALRDDPPSTRSPTQPDVVVPMSIQLSMKIAPVDREKHPHSLAFW